MCPEFIGSTLGINTCGEVKETVGQREEVAVGVVTTGSANPMVSSAAGMPSELDVAGQARYLGIVQPLDAV